MTPSLSPKTIIVRPKAYNLLTVVACSVNSLNVSSLDAAVLTVKRLTDPRDREVHVPHAFVNLKTPIIFYAFLFFQANPAWQWASG